MVGFEEEVVWLCVLYTRRRLAVVGFWALVI